MSKKYLLLPVIIFLLIPRILYSFDYYALGCRPAEEAKKKKQAITEETPAQIPLQPAEKVIPPTPDKTKKVSRCEIKKYRQAGIFKTRKEAERYAEKLRKSGCNTIVRIGFTKSKKKIYRVYAKKSVSKTKMVISSAKPPVAKETTVSNVPVKEESHPRDIAPTETVSKYVSSVETPEKESVSIATLPAEQEKTVQPIKPKDETQYKTVAEKKPLEEMPIGREKPSWDIFGRRSGYLHPFISITEYYTDNVFNTNDAEENDFVTIISPGIWISIPHIYDKLLKIETSNISPGGYTLSRYKPEYFRRYQTYIFYNADIEEFSEFTDEDTVNHRFEGFFQYNLKGGLSFEVVDQYLDSHDVRGTGISQELDTFKTNLFHGIGVYDISERFRLRFDYSLFSVNYDEERNDFRDRNDNSIYGYVFYKFQPKTALFIEYEYLDIDYKKEQTSSSIEQHYFAGIQWDATAKSKGSIKVGYGVKEFSFDNEEDSDFILEIQIDYKFTPKTSLLLRALRRTTETNIATTDFILSNTFEAEYIQKVTGKITADIKLVYENDNYNGLLTFAGETKEREDNYFSGMFSIQYDFREWLKTAIGFIHTRRDSNFSSFDYKTNSIFFRITAAL
ncbi:MAG: outer membrane beta-barrel protein [Nitrospirae bacterium]|nr:outer membrane beta-barrel protein [Nitrospirota bacterium]